MGSLGPNDMATMYEARKKVNNDRQTGLVDVPRLRAEVLAMHGEQNVSDEAAMKIKYAYLAKASPSLFALLCKGTDFRLDAIMKLLDDVERVERKEISNETVGENIVRNAMSGAKK